MEGPAQRLKLSSGFTALVLLVNGVANASAASASLVSRREQSPPSATAALGPQRNTLPKETVRCFL